MRKSTVVNLGKFKFVEYIRKNDILLLMALFFVIGIFSASYTINTSITKNIATFLLDDFSKKREGLTFIFVALNSFLSSLLYLLVLFIFGTTMLGVVLSPIAVAVRGFMYGSLSALLYSEYSVKGVAFNAVIVLPGAIVFLICVLLASRESLKFSLILARMTFPKSCPVNLNADFRNYCIHYLCFAGLALVSALTDAILSNSFITYFKI